MLPFESKRSKSNTLIWGGFSAISVGLFTWASKLETAREVNFNQIRLYFSYHMLSRASQDRGESEHLMLYASFFSISHIFIHVKVYEHQLLGNTEDEYAKCRERSRRQGREKGRNGQQLFRVADFSLVFSSLSHFLEAALWSLKLGAQESQLTKVHLPRKKRTFINIQSTFHNLISPFTFYGLRNWEPEFMEIGKIFENPNSVWF